MQTIITAAAIFSMYLNAAENSNSEYYYNADMENGKVTNMYVFTEEGQNLSGKVAYHYECVASNCHTRKRAMRYRCGTGAVTTKPMSLSWKKLFTTMPSIR